MDEAGIGIRRPASRLLQQASPIILRSTGGAAHKALFVVREVRGRDRAQDSRARSRLPSAKPPQIDGGHAGRCFEPYDVAASARADCRLPSQGLAARANEQLARFDLEIEADPTALTSG